jgi:hypothetical protein
VDGGSAITLRDAPIGMGGSWGEDGNIIAAVNAGGGLSRIPSAGGEPTPVTDLQNGEATHRWPQILPGGSQCESGGWSSQGCDGIDLLHSEGPSVYKGAIR